MMPLILWLTDFFTLVGMVFAGGLARLVSNADIG